MAAITTAAIAVAGSAYQIAQAEKSKKEAKNAIKNFNRQELKNPYADLQISTLASEQATEANNTNFATSVDALQRGGTRAVLGGIPQISQNNILLQNMISADIDKQDKERQMLFARGEESITATRENRETNALIGLGQQLQVGRQDSASAQGSAFKGLLAMGTAIDSKNNPAPPTTGNGSVSASIFNNPTYQSGFMSQAEIDAINNRYTS